MSSRIVDVALAAAYSIEYRQKMDSMMKNVKVPSDVMRGPCASMVGQTAARMVGTRVPHHCLLCTQREMP